jgi:small-conductance mechanosensitive channel
MKRLHERYRAERIEIPYPVRRVIVQEPSEDGHGSWIDRTGDVRARN